MSVRHYDSDTALALYHRLIEKTVFSGKRTDYEKTLDYLTDLRTLYEECDQKHQWIHYLTTFRKRQARKRLLLQIIDV